MHCLLLCLLHQGKTALQLCVPLLHCSFSANRHALAKWCSCTASCCACCTKERPLCSSVFRCCIALSLPIGMLWPNGAHALPPAVLAAPRKDRSAALCSAV